ncbi:MAG: squalene/phytoene synthase family protein [Verrucomicrobiales bacterium]|nr:squalene/phytoene synthase family protein [Verrucomicrobiales bacterium]
MERTIDEIVRGSRSNLALTLACLPRARRGDMRIFYAFCRVVDDIADEPGRNSDQKRSELDRWRKIVTGAAPAVSLVEREVAALQERQGIPSADLLGIIDGVAQDVEPARFVTWEDLRSYCHGVACCVGFVSIRIFGCTRPESRGYAEHLGYALQLTNILRDVGQDFANGGRIYLPVEDCERHGVTADHFHQRRLDGAFLNLMQFEAARARDHFDKAAGFLTKEDARKLRAAEAMRGIYRTLLGKMEQDGFRVFDRRYRLSSPHKLWLMLRALRGWL